MATTSKSTTAPSPAPSPSTSSTTAPKAVGDTVSITAFSAASPTVATLAAGDGAKLANGDTLTLAVTAGTCPEVDGQSAAVSALSGDSCTLALDLSAVTVDGVTATGTVASSAPAPSPPPNPPDPEEVQDVLVQALTSFPSPGVGALPTAPNPNDTPPGTWVGMVINPRNPDEKKPVSEVGGVDAPYIIRPGDAFNKPEAIPRPDKLDYTRSKLNKVAKERADELREKVGAPAPMELPEGVNPGDIPDFTFPGTTQPASPSMASAETPPVADDGTGVQGARSYPASDGTAASTEQRTASDGTTAGTKSYPATTSTKSTSTNTK